MKNLTADEAEHNVEQSQIPTDIKINFWFLMVLKQKIFK